MSEIEKPKVGERYMTYTQKDIKATLEDIITTLEDKRQRERNIYVLYAHSDERKTPHVAAVIGRESGLTTAIEIVKDELKEVDERETRNRLEVMDDSIEAMMSQAATHSGIKLQNSYVTLAHILKSYSERCFRLSEQKPKEGTSWNCGKRKATQIVYGYPICDECAEEGIDPEEMTSDKEWLRVIGNWNGLEDIIATLELAPQHERDKHTKPIRKDMYFYSHEMAPIGREAGLPKAIEIVKDKPKTLESTKEKGRKEQSCEGCQYKDADNCPAREARDNREEEFKKILKRTMEANRDLLIELSKQ